MKVLDMARRWLFAPIVIMAGLITARIAFHEDAASEPYRTTGRDVISANADIGGPAPNSFSENGLPRSEKTVDSAPVALESGGEPKIAQTDAALYRLHLLREKLAQINTLEELKHSGIPEQLEASYGENNFFAAVEVLFEIAQTKKPWAYEYLDEVAQQETPDNPEGSAEEENKRRSKWELHTRRAAIAALFSVNTPESQRMLKTLYANSLTGESPLSRWEVLNTAAEAKTEFSSALYLDAFRNADRDMRRKLASAIPFQQSVADNDVRMQILRETLANQDDAELSSQAVRTLLEERHLQYPGGAERATALLTDAFDARDPDGQSAMLLDIEASQDGWANTGEREAGNLQAIDVLLARGTNSEVESVRNTASEIEQRLANSVDADAVQRQLAGDMLQFQEICNTVQ